MDKQILINEAKYLISQIDKYPNKHHKIGDLLYSFWKEFLEFVKEIETPEMIFETRELYDSYEPELLNTIKIMLLIEFLKHKGIKI